MHTKLILDTDIGTDADDAWALLFALASPEFDLQLATLVHADLDVRAQIAIKLLKLAGREDVPVAKGLRQTLTLGGRTVWLGHEGTEIDFSDVDAGAVTDDAVERIVETIRANPGEVVLVSIGPMTNVAAAIRQSPEIVGLVRRCFIMGATFNGLGPENAGREHNAGVDPVATKTVLESGMPITLVGLNVTTQTALRREQLARLEGRGPLADYMLAMTRQWLEVIGKDECHMHDPLTLAAAVDPDVIQTRRLSPEVRDDGAVVFYEPGSGASSAAVDVATTVNLDRFDNLFFGRGRSFIERRQQCK